MSGKAEQKSQEAAGETVSHEALFEAAPHALVPLEPWARVEALKIAIEMRSTTTPASTVIVNAKEFEAYILTGERRSREEAEGK